MKTEIITLTPAKAAILLKNNDNNRKVNAHHVNFLANEIAAGNWKINGQSIVIDEDGNLLDGQHRCHAVIKANTSIETIFFDGALRSSMNTIDTGKSRNAADVFNLHNVVYAPRKATISASVYRWYLKKSGADSGALSGSLKPSNDKLYNIYMSDNENIDWASKKADPKYLGFFNKSKLALAFYLLQDRHGKAKVEEFIHYIKDGGDYPKSPTHYLPLFIQNRRSSDIKRHRQEDLLIVLHCFELWINSNKVSTIRVKSLFNNIDKFYKKYPLPQRVILACE